MGLRAQGDLANPNPSRNPNPIANPNQVQALRAQLVALGGGDNQRMAGELRTAPGDTTPAQA